MRSWIFRNRARLAALTGRPAPAQRNEAARASAGASPPRTPRVVVLVPVRHP